MRWQWIVGLALAVCAALLLARDLRRAGADPLRRPITLLAASLIVVVLAGTFGGRAIPHPAWLAIPAAVLGWESLRGWRRMPRCHYWEAGIGAWSVALVLAGAGLTMQGELLLPLLLAAAAAGGIGLALWWRSTRREPHPWRAQDPDHYERRDLSRRADPC